ncbi:site-specific integrase [Clostridium sp. YIM B02555]|uniref:tyrosine-type recombinase/integrase n=1 Tax=Clostridium sp. YIM B02555 TaxID=2911968 RepID=UPI001EEEE0B6|nr:site-specific integrase [Clostridium sp. YIM B02555]
MDLLREFQIEEEHKNLNIKEYIQFLGIEENREHLSKEEYNQILSLLVKQGKMSTMTRKHNIKLYEMTIHKFPNVNDWESAKPEDKIIQYPVYKITNIRYYHIMLMCKRLKGDWNILGNKGYHFPDILTNEEKFLIINSMKAAKYNEVGFKYVCNQFIKIILATGKELKEISEDDIYKYREFQLNAKANRELFNIAKRISRVGATLNYEVIKRDLKENNLNNGNEVMRKHYFQYIYRINDTQSRSTANHSKHIARIFVDWIWNNYSEIDNYIDINIDHIEEFANWNRTRISEGTNKTRTISVCNSELSKLRGFLLYLKKKNLLNYDLVKFIIGRNCEFFKLRQKRPTIRPLPVPIKDRIAIEKAIYGMDESTEYLYIKKNMMKLIYHMALRPSEVISAKWDCITGTKESPNFHVHMAKGFKERYIPLIPEVINIIKELQNFSKESIPIYKEWDGEMVKRLFAFNDRVINTESLRDTFNKLLVENGIVNHDNKPKYSLYILRKIRITTWLEFGISEISVAEMVGHEDLESLYYYIVSKESRTKNAAKVFSTFYEDVITQVKKNGYYEKSNDIVQFQKNYIEELSRQLLEIEKKSINMVALEMAFKEFPEFALPLPCGSCLAMILNEEDFECEKMKIPCLECKDLKVENIHIKVFDNLVKRIYIARKLHKKNKLKGLINRDDLLLERLIRFYEIKFNLLADDVTKHFECLFKVALSKESRKECRK